MKEVKEKEEKTTMDELRAIREKVSCETQNMTFTELKKYVDSQLHESLHPPTVWT